MKKVVLGILVAMSSPSIMAAQIEPANHWVAGISYLNLSDESDGFDISLGGIAGSIGYKFKSGETFYLIPEARVGIGIGSDNVSESGIDIDMELDSFVAFSVRGQFEFDNGMYVYVAPSYANAKFTATASLGGVTAKVSDDSWELGVGGGVGYQFNKTLAAELSYEQFDGTDMLSVGVKFNF